LGFEGEWEEFVERLTRNLVPALRRRLYMAQLERLGGLGPPSEKLVYLYLALSGPQSFTTIRRGLALSIKTIDRAIRSLRDRGFIAQNERYLYWIIEVSENFGL
jgi:DNA-binding MarR family transcriptional regulator